MDTERRLRGRPFANPGNRRHGRRDRMTGFPVRRAKVGILLVADRSFQR
jgi:hypothetical protein